MLEDGADVPVADNFTVGGIVSGNSVSTGGVPADFGIILDAGEYDVYFLFKDQAGNISTVSAKVDLTKNLKGNFIFNRERLMRMRGSFSFYVSAFGYTLAGCPTYVR